MILYLRGVYDPDSKKMVIEFKSTFLDNHFGTLKTCFEKRKSNGTLPQDLEVRKVSDDRCHISVHMETPPKTNTLPEDLATGLTRALEEFRTISMKKVFKSTEFIPLQGYPLANLQEDIQAAIKNKRNFCIIDDYNEYKRFSNGETTKLNQITVNFLSNEYSDAAIYIYQGNMRKLREYFTPKLTETDWN